MKKWGKTAFKVLVLSFILEFFAFNYKHFESYFFEIAKEYTVSNSNGKKFEIKKDNKLSVKIIKRKPSAGDITWVENVSDGKLEVLI